VGKNCYCYLLSVRKRTLQHLIASLLELASILVQARLDSGRAFDQENIESILTSSYDVHPLSIIILGAPGAGLSHVFAKSKSLAYKDIK
jgi:hypothetical protein